MRNLLDFIWNNHFTILFLFLELIGFFLLLNFNGFHQSKLQQASVAISGEVFDLQFAYTKYLGLAVENKKLRKANAALLDERLNLKSERQKTTGPFKTIPAQAIQSTYHLENNYIIINAGRQNGVKPASAVISDEGVVGIVHSTSENYASVLPLLHSQSHISARLAQTEYFGQCRWAGINPNEVILENIPNHVQIDSGALIITRGGGGVFPPGIPIGNAISTEKDESSGFQEIQVAVSTNFRKLNGLYVILNETKPELDSILNETTEWIE